MFVLKALFVLTFLCKTGAEAVDPDETKFTQFDFSSYERNSPFFSKEFKSRLRQWNKTLINASTYCAKSSGIEGSAIEERVRFPVFNTIEVDGEDEFEFLTFETFHPVLVRQKNQHDLATVAHLAIVELWPLLVLCFSCAALSGVIIWLLESRSNSEEFPASFKKGIFDGIWWAVVTMTTVGYGDKVPKSLLARLFATVWMITGIILLSMFTAQVSSRLTAEELQSGNHLFGKTIGVPPGLYQSYYVDYKLAYSIVEEVSNPLQFVSTMTDESLDSVVVFHCDDKEFDNSSQVLQFLPPCQVGADISFYTNEFFGDEWNTTEEENYVKCLKKKTRLSRNSRRRNNKKAEKSPSCKVLLEKNAKFKFEFHWVFFGSPQQFFIPFGILIGTVVLVTLTGTTWDCFRRKKRNNFAAKRDEVSQRSNAKEDEPGSNTAGSHDPKITSLEMS